MHNKTKLLIVATFVILLYGVDQIIQDFAALIVGLYYIRLYIIAFFLTIFFYIIECQSHMVQPNTSWPFAV